MQRRFLFALLFMSCFTLVARSQNNAPFWSLSGNSNAISSSKLGTINSIPLNLITNNATRMKIFENGRIGVGTSITSSNAARVFNLADPNAVLRILRIDPSNAPAVELISRTSANGSNIAYWDMYAEPSDASFRIRDRIDGRSGLDRFIINNAGNVGIGITKPMFALDVANATTDRIINAQSTYKGSVDKIAFFGSSFNAPGYGYGVYAEGGYIGVYGDAIANSNTGNAYGTYGHVSGDVGVGNHYGIFGVAYDGANAYGVYGSANGGTTTNAAGYFNGTIYATSYMSASDRKFKQNIATVKGALSNLMKLKPSNYEFKVDEYKSMGLARGKQSGLIADEVKQVFPELVQTAVKPALYDPKDRNKIVEPEVQYEAVNYQGLIPVLVAATQEQQAQIEKDRQQMESLENENNELKQRLTRIEEMLSKSNNPVALSFAYLGDASPNPSNNNVIIRYRLPDGKTVAKIRLANQQGQVVEELATNSEVGQINLSTTNLPAGIYTYSLWTNGQQTAAKQLIVAH